MLHAVLPPPLSPSGRRLYHSQLFRQREREFDDYERAMAWERRFVGDDCKPPPFASAPTSFAADTPAVALTDMALLADTPQPENRSVPPVDCGPQGTL
jgi:hypothetical protein